MYATGDRRNAPIVVLLFAAIFAPAGLIAQNGAAQKPDSSFTFRQGQTVYITAYHTIEHAASGRGLNVIPALHSVDSHLPAELQVRKDFEKRKVYKLMNKASDADFVFLVIIHDSAAEGLALAPAVFAEYRNPLNIEALREAAYARTTAGPLKIHNLGRISDHLVKKFHSEQARSARPKP